MAPESHSAALADHTSTEVLGLPVNLDTLLATVVAAAAVILVGAWVAQHARPGVPGRLQLVFETVVTATRRHLTGSEHGGAATGAVGLVLSLALFILFANWLAVLPLGVAGGWLSVPTADINLTLGLGLVVAAWVLATALRSKGAGGYLRELGRPSWWFLPIKVIDELVRPLSLALRLFGTIFASTVVVFLIGELIPPAVAPIPHAAWKMIDVLSGGFQAFIFALLTVLYVRSARETTRVRVDPATVPAERR
jgi:F-type H+-transporting ATPase subunit a